MVKLQHGFTLIETLVAMVILSISFVAIWDWLSTANQTTSKIEENIVLPETIHQFHSFLMTISFDNQNEGIFEIGEHSVHWQAKLVQKSDEFLYRRQTNWIVAKYAVDFEVHSQLGVMFDNTFIIIRQWEDPNAFDTSIFSGRRIGSNG
ncbi:type II secretion system protein J [Glaciecola sp. KUL10]|uniref:PulJ/GspJ family protein n=1 Tax=Glaciecola sp. (strain KUL10) TaxID=2161813 RepID=UPI000D78C144|nr:type II secretion system protein [Glaciecola sp. KUL10]GBL04172.1 prepilin-type cleavage/methylation [Glaciecola sp. KUL10]